MRVEKLVLSRKEVEAFETVNTILTAIQDNCFSSADLISQITGEVICVNDLARIKSILGFFYENPIQIFIIKNTDH